MTATPLCHHLPNSLSSDKAEAASTATRLPTAMEFAVATCTELKPRTNGAITSHMPAARLIHSGASSSNAASKWQPRASARPRNTALPVALSCSVYPTIQGESASHRPSVKLAQSCHRVAALFMVRSLTGSPAGTTSLDSNVGTAVRQKHVAAA